MSVLHKRADTSLDFIRNVIVYIIKMVSFVQSNTRLYIQLHAFSYTYRYTQNIRLVHETTKDVTTVELPMYKKVWQINKKYWETLVTSVPMGRV